VYYISPLEGRVKTPLKKIPIFKPQIQKIEIWKAEKHPDR
jgi:hypothetical protein